ncbi:MBL fold metallo-hydrolase [Demequina sp. TTPB684]|uniref:MBL fold metallo-hydrolase n=1 Tax=unclassified Demequina TaxID=2620311 RepID=UPI001CF38D7F|nr:MULTISPECIES: MBL fold metallo-hydrolase [unclassified Demequina]MCB2412089.1 MBL fold metallo-hydrolase [Demequina sp. TTPB684]UPU88622.1 MBL fold metallo-hydrolase [Demequina sp. TMPB413]
MSNDVTLTLVGGPTVLMRYAGLTIVTDPTFDPPGPHGSGLTKTEGPAIPADALGAVDLALVSHDHHPDNLDDAGLAVARAATLALTTAKGGKRVQGLEGMKPGDERVVSGETEVTVTAVHAQHGPRALASVLGPVIGFVVRADGWPTVYFSGDNSSVAVAGRIASEHPDVGVALLCMGSAKVTSRGTAPLTLDAARAARVAALWPSATIVPIHVDGWAHFTQLRADTAAELERRGLGARTVNLAPGVATEVSA